jgi:predicted anti-sigma-YlaC factor YlaD
MVKLLGKIELVLGLLMTSYASYLMIEFTLNPAYDPHGFILMLALFGAGIGGLMSFAGTVCIFSSKYKILSQMPLIIYTIITIYTFSNAYD